MRKCKSCKTRAQKGEKFCAVCGAPLPRELPAGAKIAIAAAAVLLALLLYSQRMGIARLTDGKLFGYRTALHITAAELEGDIAPPSEKEAEKLRKYAGDWNDYGKGLLFGKKKTLYREYSALFLLLADCADGSTALDLDTLQDEYDACLRQAKRSSSLLSEPLAGFSVTAFAAETTQQDRAAYLATLLKNSAATMFVHGEQSLAVTLAAMAAELAPRDASVTNLLANVLKEYNMLDTTYDMLHYTLRLEPDNQTALHSLGMLCIDQQKYDEARLCFDRMLRLTGGTGPANQGHMLLALAEGDMPSAYLYMLEGARDGYTHTITQVYQALRGRPDYFDIAGPIFDQYPLYELVKFTRTQPVFDATLDTIDQQVVIDRKMVLCKDAVAAIGVQGINLLQGKKYGEELAAQVLANIVGYFSTLSEEFSLAGQLLSDPDLGKLLDGDTSAIWALRDKYAPPEPEEMTFTYSYEQEVFFLKILDDWLQYNIKKNQSKYWQPALDMLDLEAPDSPLAQFMVIGKDYLETDLAEYVRNVSEADEAIQRMDFYTFLINYAKAMGFLAGNLESNDNMMLTDEFTAAEFNVMNAVMQKVAPMLEKGYQETAILCEEYYLYTNSILGCIADDSIYNEHRFFQQFNVQLALFPYPMAGCVYNQCLGALATMVYGSAAGTDLTPQDIHLPDVPEFPVTGMGTPDGEPVVVWEFTPPPAPAIAEAADELWRDAIESDLDRMEEQYGVTQNTLLEETEPYVVVDLDPAQDKPAISGQLEIASPVSLKFKLGKIVELSIDPATGELSFGASAIVVGGKVSVNLRTTDITLYGHLGGDQSLGVQAGGEDSASAEWVGAKAGFYSKMTLNVNQLDITSAEVGADLGGSIAGFGAEVTVGYDFASGVKRETATTLLGLAKHTSTAETKIE